MSFSWSGRCVCRRAFPYTTAPHERRAARHPRSHRSTQGRPVGSWGGSLRLIGHAQHNQIHAAEVAAALRRHDGQPRIDVSGLPFFGQRHVPQVGHGIAHALLLAHFRGQLFAIDKGHHAAEIGAFHVRQPLQGLGDGLQSGQNVALEERCGDLFLVERGRRKAVEHASEAMERKVELPEDDGVAQADGLPKQLLIEIDDHQSAGQRVFGIEQPDVGLVVAYVEILAQHAVVEQQLHVVVFLLIRPVLVGKVALDVEVLARFLLHEQLHVGRHEVDAALQAQLLAHEGRFQENLTAVVGERRAGFEHRRTELAE